MAESKPTGHHSSDPQGLVGEVAHERISRRQFMERALGLGLSVSAVGALLAACGGEPSSPTASPPSPMVTIKPEKVYLYNWSDYMAPGIKKGFEQKYGIEVVETYFDEAEPILAKLKAGATGYDVIIASDYMVSIMRKSRLIEPLDMRYIPNFANVDAQFEHPIYDDPDANGGARYSAPYQWGTTGYAVRTDKVDPASVGAWSDLWDPQYTGKIHMLNDERETPAAALMKVGLEKTGAAWSINTTDQAQVDQATQALIEQKPLVRRYDSVNMKRAMVSGVPLVHCWSGDATMAVDALRKEWMFEAQISSLSPYPAFESPIAYMLPREGFPWWVDCMAVPEGCRSRYGAHLFIDYLLDPKVQGKLSNYTRYLPTTGEASRPYTDPSLYAFVPTPQDMARGQAYTDVGDFGRQYSEAWAKVKSA